MKTTLNHLSALGAVVLMSLALPVHAGTPSYYIYDESGHAIGEYDANGNPVQEHVYLGDRPVAVAVTNSGTTTVDYVSTDQLNAPRVITDSSQTVLWSWNSDPFGNGNPTGSLTYDLRFPGQQYDSETGHDYNYYRDYDASTGRYSESDPIGLGGGVNSYTYTVDNPMTRADLVGLYSPGWHSAFTQTGAEMSGASVSAAAGLGQLVAGVDNLPGSQNEGNAIWHGMCPGYASAMDCANWFQAYMNSELDRCDLEGLARALHALQDSFAAGHSGFQPYYGWYALFAMDLFSGNHFEGDYFPSELEQTLVTNFSAQLIQRFERKCHCHI